MSIEITTQRLRLRQHRLEDLSQTHALWTSAEVYQFISGKPSTLQQSAGRLYNYLGHWQLHGFGYLVVEDKASGEFMGEVGIANFFRDLEPKMNSPFELGWVLAPQFHGHGFALEAMSTLIKWHRQKFPPQTYWCMIDKRNTPSIKLAEKLDLKFTHVGSYNGESINLYIQRPSII